MGITSENKEKKEEKITKEDDHVFKIPSLEVFISQKNKSNKLLSPPLKNKETNNDEKLSINHNDKLFDKLMEDECEEDDTIENEENSHLRINIEENKPDEPEEVENKTDTVD